MSALHRRSVVAHGVAAAGGTQGRNAPRSFVVQRKRACGSVVLGLWEVTGGAGAWAQRGRTSPARGGAGSGVGRHRSLINGFYVAEGVHAFELLRSQHDEHLSYFATTYV